jgi:two-component SAPR family response regulator
MTMSQSLTVMVAEDSHFVALDLKKKIEKMGHSVLGPFKSVGDTMAAVLEGRLEFAFLDVELMDGRSFKAAAQLNDMGIPFVFVTARTDLVEEAGFDPTKIVLKPFQQGDLKKALDFGMSEKRNANSE